MFDAIKREPTLDLYRRLAAELAVFQPMHAARLLSRAMTAERGSDRAWARCHLIRAYDRARRYLWGWEA